MKYVSAHWVTSATGAAPTIKATGDDGVEYFIPSEDSDVPPWPEYLAEGGTIDPDPAPPAPPPSDLANQITDVPKTLTGGPTIREVFYGND